MLEESTIRDKLALDADEVIRAVHVDQLGGKDKDCVACMMFKCTKLKGEVSERQEMLRQLLLNLDPPVWQQQIEVEIMKVETTNSVIDSQETVC